MAYVTVPKDLTKVKSKVVFGLTKRQLICFGGALLIGVPLFFLIRGRVPTMEVVDNASDENNENTRRKATVVPIKIEYV